MACSRQANLESMCSPPSRAIRAVIGCFLADDAGNVYALVNRHVTRSLNDCIYIVKKDGTSVSFGSPVSTQKFEDENLLLNDIDIIKVVDDLKLRCKSVFQASTSETASSYKIYDGNVNDLYNAKAHMCFTSEEIVKKANELKGTISELPQSLVVCYSTDTCNYFMFTRQSDQSCANPGESGTVIAKDCDNGSVELVGIIAHGDFKPLGKNSIDIERCNTISNNPICLLLNKGITFLEQKYGLKLSLYSWSATDVDIIESGRSYTFQS